MAQIGQETLIDVRCTNCGTVIAVTEALQQQIAEFLRQIGAAGRLSRLLGRLRIVCRRVLVGW